MNMKLTNKKIAILATDGFQQDELVEPKKALEAAGADVKIVSPKKGVIKGWKEANWAQSVPVDLAIEDATFEDFDALMLPGGLMNPDRLRMDDEAVNFVRRFALAGKPIAAICHGPQLLIEAEVVRGRRLTSWPAIKTDLINAGAQWEDSEVVVDRGLVTSRRPADLTAFNEKMIEEFAEGPHPIFEKQFQKSPNRTTGVSRHF